MSHHFAKPENALRKALDLVKVDKDDAALRILHNMLLSRRYRLWQPTHEQIMMLYIQLAVENRKNTKDGLLQYRNICQSANTDSLEKVIKEFIRLAEAKAAEAESISEAGAETSVQTVAAEPAPLDETVGYRPEVVHYFVQGVGGEDDIDRSKRQIVTPWLKYLWDTYRTVLDVMRNNQHLDKLYHRTVRKALAYCGTHQRTSEFRRLCEIMRIHLTAIVTYQQTQNAVDISSPETVQAYLRTRFAQLECASQLDLWQEAYRIIEDIHELLLRSKIDVGLDESLLSTYYEKLELIFWKSSNPLFHTYCVDKRFQFAVSQKVEQEEITKLADRLIVAGLSIQPVAGESNTKDESRSALLDSEDQKNARLAAMLGFPGPPSRARILHKIKTENILQHASKTIQNVFSLVVSSESNRVQSPYTISATSHVLLEEIATMPHLSQYAANLAKTFVLLVLQQCSHVYKVLRMDSFLKLVPKQFSAFEIEKFIVLWVKDQLVRVRVDHTKNRLLFDSDPTAAPSFLDQLPRLAVALQNIVDKIHPVSPTDVEFQRQQVFQLVKQGMDHEHRDVFIRQQVIEKRKQETEQAALRREFDEKVRIQRNKQKKMEEEQERLAEEKRRREKEREERLEKERIIASNIALIEKLKLAASSAAGGDESTTIRSRKIIETLEEDFENVDREKLLEAQNEVQNQEQRARERKLREDMKRLDYVSRALRIEEKPLLVEAYKRQREEDRQYYDQMWLKHVEAHRERHHKSVADKSRLGRMLHYRDVFYKKIMEKRERIHQEQVEIYEEALREKEAERAEELKRLAALELERERKAEEAAALKAAEEEELRRIKQQQEESRAKAAEAEAERRAQLDRTAEIQRKREEEIAAKKAAASAEAAASASQARAQAGEDWRRSAPTHVSASKAWWRDDSTYQHETLRPNSRPVDAGARDFGALRNGPSDRTVPKADAGGVPSEAPRLNLTSTKGLPSGTSWRDKLKAKEQSNGAQQR